MKTLLLAAFLFAVTINAADGYFYDPWIFGPKAPTVFFNGRITTNGKPTPALVSVEILYKVGDQELPLSVVQVNSLPDYHIGVSGILLQDPKLQHSAFIRVQSLSADGRSRVVKFKLDDEKYEYNHDVELGRKHKSRGLKEE